MNKNVSLTSTDRRIKIFLSQSYYAHTIILRAIQKLDEFSRLTHVRCITLYNTGWHTHACSRYNTSLQLFSVLHHPGTGSPTLFSRPVNMSITFMHATPRPYCTALNSAEPSLIYFATTLLPVENYGCAYSFVRCEWQTHFPRPTSLHRCGRIIPDSGISSSRTFRLTTQLQGYTIPPTLRGAFY